MSPGSGPGPIQYRVRACNAAGCSAWSETVLAVAPIAPDPLVLSVRSRSEIRLTWRDRSSDETGFRIERSGNGTDFAFLATVGADVATYRDPGLASKQRYYYRVCAVRGNMASAWTPVASATTR